MAILIRTRDVAARPTQVRHLVGGMGQLETKAPHLIPTHCTRSVCKDLDPPQVHRWQLVSAGDQTIVARKPAAEPASSHTTDRTSR